SEKSYTMAKENRYTFVVASDANKTEIKRAVEEIFKVKALDVSVANAKPKPITRARRRARITGYRPGYKKATVTLRKGDKIEFFENV
ncbi:large subunit ribosomal protein L23, partial [Candidatus Hakubella thermalkaliphila]